MPGCNMPNTRKHKVWLAVALSAALLLPCRHTPALLHLTQMTLQMLRGSAVVQQTPAIPVQAEDGSQCSSLDHTMKCQVNMLNLRMRLARLCCKQCHAHWSLQLLYTIRHGWYGTHSEVAVTVNSDSNSNSNCTSNSTCNSKRDSNSNSCEPCDCLQIIIANYIFTAAFTVEVLLQATARNLIIGPNGDPPPSPPSPTFPAPCLFLCAQKAVSFEHNCKHELSLCICTTLQIHNLHHTAVTWYVSCYSYAVCITLQVHSMH